MVRPSGPIFGRLPLVASEVRNFHAHRPRMRGFDLCDPEGTFVALQGDP